MKLQKCLLFFKLLFYQASKISDQQKVVLSPNMFNGLATGPVDSGRFEYTSLKAMYRDQWVIVP